MPSFAALWNTIFLINFVFLQHYKLFTTDAARYRHLQHFPCRNGHHCRGGICGIALHKRRIWNDVHSPMGPVDWQPRRVGADGSPSVHRYGHTMVLQRPAVSNRTTNNFHAVPVALLPKGVHLPLFHQGEQPNAPVDNRHGCDIQRAQRSDARRLAVLPRTRRPLQHRLAVHSAIRCRSNGIFHGNGNKHKQRQHNTQPAPPRRQQALPATWRNVQLCVECQLLWRAA